MIPKLRVSQKPADKCGRLLGWNIEANEIITFMTHQRMEEA
jgi:hypothetical protein